MSHSIAQRYGFPPPRVGLAVRDALGRIWKWNDDPPGRGLGSLGELGELGAWTSIVGAGSAVAGTGLGIAGSLGAGAGALFGPIGAAVGLLGSLISGIFGQHAAKVQQENKVSGQWAAAGPQDISAIMAAWQSGQLSSSDASTALQNIYPQFLQANQSIVKYNGSATFPDPNGPRPSSNCNWACGTSWDLAQELKGLQAQIAANPSVGAPTVSSVASSLTSNPLALLALAAGALLLLK